MFAQLLVVHVQVMLLLHVPLLLSYRKQGFVVQAMMNSGELGISTWLIMLHGLVVIALVISVLVPRYLRQLVLSHSRVVLQDRVVSQAVV
jgi:hypothetical protein